VVLTYSSFRSPLGPLALVTREAALLALAFDADPDAVAASLARLLGATARRGRPPREVTGPLGDYFGGEIDAIDRIEVSFGGTPFQQRVWTALRRISPGTTTSYSGLARRIGQPDAVRAVGTANGANPIAVVVPCHRVIGANGSLVGYGGGLDRKRWLLAHEGVMPGRLW
jgi:methylated-DNA-[protein]-cysteine S-methyltransferase